MTFSQEVKNEILKSARNLSGGNATSFLAAVLKSAGSLVIDFDGFAFCLDSDNADLLALCQKFAQAEFNSQVEIVTHDKKAKRQPAYTCTFPLEVGQGLGLASRDGDGSFCLCDDASALIPNEPAAKRSFLQGLFVAGGSVVIPMLNEEEHWSNTLNTKYHLELRFTDEAFAAAVAESFSELQFRTLSRKTHVVLYLKDSDRIADFLVFVNATSASFALENVKISRSIRNKYNRANNCEIGNIGKTVKAAGEQLQAIATLRQKGMFDTLPDPLKDIALLREQNNEATLDEIADVLHISKSGASHRFAKLIELSQRKN